MPPAELKHFEYLWVTRHSSTPTDKRAKDHSKTSFGEFTRHSLLFLCFVFKAANQNSCTFSKFYYLFSFLKKLVNASPWPLVHHSIYVFVIKNAKHTSKWTPNNWEFKKRRTVSVTTQKKKAFFFFDWLVTFIPVLLSWGTKAAYKMRPFKNKCLETSFGSEFKKKTWCWWFNILFSLGLQCKRFSSFTYKTPPLSRRFPPPIPSASSLIYLIHF